ncbi:MAG: membrane protein insertase YidC [Clostridia bacterium]|nr:membrane protein insertase YidC [Clostridia bacterium]
MSFGEIITWPFSWLLLTLYELTTNYGVAILLFAVVIKVVLLPFQMKSKRSTMRTSRLNPLMKELEKKYGDDKQRYQQEVARLYKEEKINPMSGCLWTLIPFPILIALYSVIRMPFTRLMRVSADVLATVKEVAAGLGYTYTDGGYAEIGLADFVHKNFDKFSDISDKIVNIDFSFLGMNLGDTPKVTFFLHTTWSDPAIWAPALGLFLIPVISAGLNYFAMKVSNVSNPAMEAQQQSMKGMMMFMPLISLYFCFVMPAALGIYWIAGSVLGILQDLILNKHYTKILDAEDAERSVRIRAREEELERKRQETERLRAQGETDRNKNTSKKKIQAADKTAQEERLAAERAAEKARRKAELGIESENDSQVGNRKYARGRAYVAERYDSGKAVDADIGDADSENSGSGD